MDRDNNWDRVEKAYDSLVTGDGIKAESATQALQESYDNGKTDEFVEPTVICKDGQPLSLVKANDSVIFFNFRPDRARERQERSAMISLQDLKERQDLFH